METPQPEAKTEQEFVPGVGVIQYPPLSAEETRIMRVLSKGLFVSRYSLSWAFYKAAAGNPDSLQRIARRMVSLPISLKNAIAGKPPETCPNCNEIYTEDNGPFIAENEDKFECYRCWSRIQ